jgi:hypothetical protein
VNSIKGINLRHPVYVELDMRTSVMEKKDIMLWSMQCMKKVSEMWMKDLEEDELVKLSFQTMEDYLLDKISVNDGRTVALKIHERARIETDKSVIFYYRALGQMTSIIHVKTHAMGHLYYTLKMCLALDLDITDIYLLEARTLLDDIQGVTS